MSKVEASKKIDELIVRLSSVDQDSLPKGVKKEFGKIAKLLLDEQLLRRQKLIDILEIVVSSLLQTPPNLALATNLRKTVQNKLKGNTVALGFRFRGLSEMAPPVVRVLGIGGFIYVAIPILLANWDSISDAKFLGLDTKTLVLVGLFGALGSIVSMLVRLADFMKDDAEKNEIDPLVILLVAFVRPIVGISFALFIYFACKSQIIPIKIPETGFETQFYLALAFVAGFSERFAKDAIMGAERRLGSAISKQPARKISSGS